MNLFKRYLKLLFFSFVLCNVYCEPEDDNDIIKQENLEILRYDVDSVGVNVENLIVDVLKQFLYDKNKNQEPVSEIATQNYETTTQIGFTETQITSENDVLSTTTEESLPSATKITKPQSNTTEESLPSTTEITKPFPKKRTHRIPRQVSQNYIPPPNNQNYYATQNCSPKTISDQQLEHQHIEELRGEVKKLTDLVTLLRDQRDILHILNENSKSTKPLLKDETRDTLIKGLAKLNEKEKATAQHLQNREIETNEVLPEVKPQHKELEHIKLQLSDAVRALNETRIIMTLERIKEETLETELRKQRHEIDNLKSIVENVLKHQGNSSVETEVKKDTIVGSGFTFFPTPTTIKPIVHEKHTTTTERPLHVTKPAVKNRASQDSGNKARASDADITRILDALGKSDQKSPSDEEISKLLDALVPEKKTTNPDLDQIREIIDKRRKQEDRIRQIKALRKLINSSGSAQSKSLDNDNVEEELKDLQNAINRLRPKEDGLDGFGRDDDEARFQAMLTKLIGNQGQSSRPAISGQSSFGGGSSSVNSFLGPSGITGNKGELRLF